jgi:hypothetical protein
MRTPKEDEMRVAGVTRAMVVVAAAAIAVVRFVAIDASSDSASDTLRPWVIQVGVTLLAALLIWMAIDRLDRSRPGAPRR